jgi:putative protein-disulfide isomerase
MQPTLLYVQDALCGWCFGFSPVMERIQARYAGRLAFEVLAGGMIPPEFAQPIAAKAAFIAKAYKQVEEHTGVHYGEAFLQHIFHPEQSPWRDESLTPATALCLLKAAAPDKAIHFASAIQRLHMAEGKNLSDGESYRQLAESLNLDGDDFIRRLQEEEWKEEARYEFALVKQLGITGFPAVLLQTAADKFYLIARGYTSFEALDATLNRALTEITEL